MDHAVQNAFDYLVAIRIVPTEGSHIKSIVKHRARQQSVKRNREVQYGSLLDLEQVRRRGPAARPPPINACHPAMTSAPQPEAGTERRGRG